MRIPKSLSLYIYSYGKTYHELCKVFGNASSHKMWPHYSSRSGKIEWSKGCSLRWPCCVLIWCSRKCLFSHSWTVFTNVVGFHQTEKWHRLLQFSITRTFQVCSGKRLCHNQLHKEKWLYWLVIHQSPSHVHLGLLHWWSATSYGLF